MKKAIRIFITGGLGNQLFQFSAALHYAHERQIELDLVTAKPRKNSNGQAEILSLNLPKNIKLVEKDYGSLSRKIFGYNLRSGYLPKKYERSHLFHWSKQFASSIYFTFALKRVFKIRVSRNLGYDEQFSTRLANEVLIGYFQTHLVAEEILRIKDSLFHHLCPREYTRYSKEAEVEIPLMVHVRLGDYKAEDQFGILSSKYYAEAVSREWESGRYRKIWLFSDDPEEARSRIPDHFEEFCRTINTEELDSAETLRIMTLCRGFIIANSTFSWWAAYLRENQADPVIAPKPWFLTLPEPVSLIPEYWTRYGGF
jgi:hypothetical protein